MAQPRGLSQSVIRSSTRAFGAVRPLEPDISRQDEQGRLEQNTTREKEVSLIHNKTGLNDLVYDEMGLALSQNHPKYLFSTYRRWLGGAEEESVRPQGSSINSKYVYVAIYAATTVTPSITHGIIAMKSNLHGLYGTRRYYNHIHEIIVQYLLAAIFLEPLNSWAQSPR